VCCDVLAEKESPTLRDHPKAVAMNRERRHGCIESIIVNCFCSDDGIRIIALI
jgi:hypothetical protein